LILYSFKLNILILTVFDSLIDTIYPFKLNVQILTVLLIFCYFKLNAPTLTDFVRLINTLLIS
jgi:hypothetical protein